MKAESWEDLERLAGIKRNVPRAPTQRDAANLTAKRLRGRYWKLKRKR